ncbi:hypothetical protein PFMC_02525 [Plasmodium falciparum CAMP/Malaysia]|uniref:Uncharacterized protein n=1 Tax=Plasmodium falciparum (isolate Camp / Malaysia) TaxID=5835 RepID=A0A024X7T1_PLAFC|nr:hypothetical protein PFMC_02525 [Plasmodium falciparum CAMP/Malaysia]
MNERINNIVIIRLKCSFVQENILKCFLLKYLLFASQLKIIRKYDKVWLIINSNI